MSVFNDRMYTGNNAQYRFFVDKNTICKDNAPVSKSLFKQNPDLKAVYETFAKMNEEELKKELSGKDKKQIANLSLAVGNIEKKLGKSGKLNFVASLIVKVWNFIAERFNLTKIEIQQYDLTKIRSIHDLLLKDDVKEIKKTPQNDERPLSKMQQRMASVTYKTKKKNH